MKLNVALYDPEPTPEYVTITLSAMQREDIEEGYAQPGDWRIILRRWMDEALNEPGDRWHRLVGIYGQCLNGIESELFVQTLSECFKGYL